MASIYNNQNNPSELDIIALQWKDLIETVPRDRHGLDRNASDKLARLVHSTDTDGYFRKENVAPRDVFRDIARKRVYIFSKEYGRELPEGGNKRPSDVVEISYDATDFPTAAKPLVRLSKPKYECAECPNKHSTPFSKRELALEKLFGRTYDVLTYQTKEGEEKTILLQDAFDGDLSLFMDELLPFEKLQVFCEVVRHLNDMHKKGFCHGDLKPENVLFRRNQDGKIEVRLADFHTAYNLDDPEYPKLDRLEKEYGSPFYTAPERICQKNLLSDKKAQGKAEECFAVGLLGMELLYGSKFYPGWPYINTAWESLQSDMPRPRNYIEEEFHSLLMQLVTERPDERLTLDAVEEKLADFSRRPITD